MDVSIEDAARLTNRSQRQVMRWIDDGKLGNGVKKDARGRWRINLDALAAVAPLDGTQLAELEQGITPAILLAKIDTLEDRVNELTQELEDLKRRPTGTSRMPNFSQRVTTPGPSDKTARAEIPPITGIDDSRAIHSLIYEGAILADVPEGTEMAQYFARRHNVNITTFASQRKNNPDLVLIIHAGRKQAEYFVDRDHKAKIVQHWRTRTHTKFTECEDSDCPCHD